MKHFPGPVRILRMFKYKEKTASTYNIQCSQLQTIQHEAQRGR